MKFCRLPADVCETDQLTQADIKVNVPQLHCNEEETLKKVMDILLSFDGGSVCQNKLRMRGRLTRFHAKKDRNTRRIL